MTQAPQPQRKQRAGGWFDRAFAQRTAFSGRFLQLYVVPVENGAGRFGVSVSKRVCPLAVTRNYVKRVLRDWHHCNRQRLGGQDIVIRVRRAQDRRDYPLVSRELETILRRFA